MSKLALVTGAGRGIGAAGSMSVCGTRRSGAPGTSASRRVSMSREGDST